LSGGELATGDELRLYPGGRAARVRGLQSHRQKVARAQPGSRTAVNLTGVSTEDVRRGDVLAPAGLLSPSQRLDVRLRLLASSPVTLKQNDEVDFFAGAAELPARVTLLDRERLAPGESGWVQLRFRAPIALLKSDRFIVRRPSPSETIGGGEVVDPNPPRHKRFRPETVDALETLAAGSPDEIVLQVVERQPLEMRSLRATSPGLTAYQVDVALEQLIAEGDVIVLGLGGEDPRPIDFVVAATLWSQLRARLGDALAAFHQAQPLRAGMAREEARRRMGITQPRLFDDVVATAVRFAAVVDDGETLRLPDFQITLDPSRRARAEPFLAALRANPYAPPGPHEYDLDAETLAALERLEEITKVADGVYFAPEAWQRLVVETLSLIDRHGSITLSQFRDHFGTSRKYAQASLEYLDQLRYTRRVGDDRLRGPRRPEREP
jgi:selenocysteine-specific elongation factor